jgi:hypothetical protein
MIDYGNIRKNRTVIAWTYYINKVILYSGKNDTHHIGDEFRNFLDGKLKWIDRLSGLVARVSDYRSRGPGFDSWRYKFSEN